MNKLIEADAIVDSLGKAMQSGETGLRYVPGLLLRIINEDLWRDRVVGKTGLVAHFDRFIDFVATQPLEGLGADLPALKRLCYGNPEALDALDRVTQKTPADNKPVDNVNEHRPTGNAAATALRRLRKYRPDLHEKVLTKKMSANAAMVEAGYRKKTITLSIDNPQAIGRAIRRLLPPDQIDEYLARLAQSARGETETP